MKNLISKIAEKYKAKPNFHMQLRNIVNLNEYFLLNVNIIDLILLSRKNC